jgi:hypothetical protein
VYELILRVDGVLLSIRWEETDWIILSENQVSFWMKREDMRIFFFAMFLNSHRERN